MTPDELQQIMPFAGTRAVAFAVPLTTAMARRGIVTKRGQAAFIAQIAHESGELQYTAEIASGEAYEGRKDLGNTVQGDGRRFKGRGLLQITGRTNYYRCGRALGVDLLRNPEQLAQTDLACQSAAWFWDDSGLTPLAEADRFGTITKRINGGYNGLDQRLAYWLRARKVLGL